MAHVYVDSNAAGAGTGADWANAYTTLAAALTAKAAGDNFWVAHNHAETQASAMTLTSPGTAAAPCTVMCVSSAGTVPPVSADLRTTATGTTTGDNKLTIAGGPTQFYGITFSGATGASTLGVDINSGGTDQAMLFRSCAIKKGGTNASDLAISICNQNSNTNSIVIFDNTTIAPGNVGDLVAIRFGRFIWKNTANAIAGAAVPVANLFASASGASCFCDGVDLSQASALVNPISLKGATSFTFKNCKTKSGESSGHSTSYGGCQMIISNSDSAATNYMSAVRVVFGGDILTETTIVRTGGATDGVTPISWLIATNTAPTWLFPLESIPISVWNDTTAANVTIDVYGTWAGGAVPKNDDIWIEASYSGSAATPIASFATNTKADFLATNANQGTDTSTWGGGTTPFKMSLTLSSPQPAMKGPITITVKAAKTSTIFYIDPKPILTPAAPIGRSMILAPGVYENERVRFRRGDLHPIDGGIAG